MIFSRSLVAAVALSCLSIAKAEPAWDIDSTVIEVVGRQGRYLEQKMDDYSLNWKHDAQDWVDKAKQGFEDVLDDASKKLEAIKGEWVNIFSHPAFPEYTLRYKEPSLCDPDIAGYLDVADDKHFFFWFFESRDKPKEDPLILWLNGGPGCSSLTGLFMELGPCIVNDAGDDTISNPYSWNANSSVIFLDQPLNVGYSYGSSSTTNSVAAAKDVYAFLQLFFKEFPQYSHLDFHVAGESYAGHYIPAIGEEIHNANKGTFSSLKVQEQADTLRPVNLASLMIGNGLTDPLVQYKYYADMACNSSYGAVLDESTCDSMRQKYPACASLIKNCYDSQSVFQCLPAAVKCNNDHIAPYQQTGMNPYDVRKKCEGGNLCYEILESVQKYLNRPEVMKELGAQVDKYESCNMQINFRFQLAGDWMRPYHRALIPILEDGIPVLIYAGDADFICNWMGNKAWTKVLPWSGQKSFAKAKDLDWYSDITQEKAGEVRTSEDGVFTFLRVYGAGHMVPYDQPANSLDFVNKWTRNKPLA
ncbi:hypothetical protein BZG36_04023 [Bifiguratus adelaidae]|uniref:Carboxypeptidase n=1 Tax=Bifiguratus adelaidae TaxID=1938954 RepID=A0A261XYN7_9FUNG|nr:hypothetical protein BZG36_04023 [Bifiguratus adelaidae]